MACRNMGDIVYRYTSPSVDNFVFRLCHRWAVVLLLVFSFIITCRLAFGDSLSCYTTNGDFTQRYMDSQCYSDMLRNDDMESRFSGGNLVGDKYIIYYPWVNLTFLLMAFVFYLPRLLWRSYESGYIRRLTAGLEISLGKEQKRSLEILCLAKYILQTKNRHRLFAYVFIFFESCNFVISIIQIVWLVNFFDIRSPTDVNIFNQPNGYRNYYFPPTGRCTLRSWGRSGDIQRYDTRCSLPLNALYMKMFFFLYSWYIVVALCTGLVLVFRVAMVAKSSRKKVLQWVVPPEHKSNAHSVSGQLSYTDWFLLTAIKKCVLDTDFNKLVEKILILMQNKGKDLSFQREDDDQSSVYEDTHKELQAPSGTPL